MKGKLKQALDESRLLILGAQVLFGFALQGAFQDAFPTLPRSSQSLHCIALVLLLCSVAILMTPSLYHRIALGGDQGASVITLATVCGAASLLPLTLGLGLSIHVTIERAVGPRASLAIAGALTAAALCLLYGWGALTRARRPAKATPQGESEPPDLAEKIDQMLTEARVLLPGVQALLGFQLAVVLTHAFDELPRAGRLTHVAGLVAIATSATLLLSTAALHRIGYRGEADAGFFRIGSALVIAATAPLAIGVAADIFVVFCKVTQRLDISAAVAAAAFLGLAALWLAFPMACRAREARRGHG